jgi:glycosyltransferase involved in cell wall biosynthesis
MQKPRLGRNGKFIKKLLRKTKSIFKGLKKTDAGFWVYSPFSLPVHHIAWLRPLNNIILQIQLRLIIRRLQIHNPVVWVACPTACDIALKLKKHSLVYQRTDLFEAYPNVDADLIKKYDKKLKANANLTIFVNYKLYEQENTQCKNALFLDHGIDYEMFANADKSNIKPIDIRKIKRPIVGYFGGIDDHSSNIPFAQKVAELLPNMSFVFIGKSSSDVTNLQKRNNVWFLGQKPYEQIPHYGKFFDVTIMPWKQNRWVDACNPIKLKEYLALGKPIVSTPFSELQKYPDVVYIAETPNEFAKCIEKALKEDNPQRISERRKKVQPYTWDNKAKLVLQKLLGNNGNF